MILGGRRSAEGGGDVSDTPEVAELSKKKIQKKKYLKPKQCHWMSFELILCLRCDVGEWEVSRGQW